MNAKDMEPTVVVGDVRKSLKDEIYRVPIVNEHGERIFVAETSLSKDTLTVVLDNDQKFNLKISKCE